MAALMQSTRREEKMKPFQVYDGHLKKVAVIMAVDAYAALREAKTRDIWCPMVDSYPVS